MRYRIIKDENIKKFFDKYPQYRTTYIYQYAPEEFIETFGEEVGYTDYWDWTYGPDVTKELFYILDGDDFAVLPYIEKTGTARYGEDDPVEVGQTDILKNLLNGYKGIVIYVYYKKERGGERYQRRIVYTYL
jgi:hypothetical protein